MTAWPSTQLDPVRIHAPGPPHFDDPSGVWVVSRYADVVAALREPNLWPVGTRGEDRSVERDDTGKLKNRVELQNALFPRIAGWQLQALSVSRAALHRLPTGCPVDLLREFAEPLCLDLAICMLGANSAERERLAALGAQDFGRVDSPDGSRPQSKADAAAAELVRVFEKSLIPRAKETFIGVSQTLPRLLASGWMALLQHPDQVERLRGEPQLMPRAVEELMRYAPIVHMISRRAMADVEVCGIHLARGGQVNLMLASANRDPQQFPDPNRLDVSRRSGNQVALGLGRDSCAGAVVVRMVAEATTSALVESFRGITPTGYVEWHIGSESCWPESVYATLQR